MEELKNTLKNRGVQNTLKLGLVAILSIFLLIPKVMIMELISERMGLRQKVEDEVAQDWSVPQVLQGPVLVIPYFVQRQEEMQQKKINVIEKRNLIIFPDKMKIEGVITTHTKSRSLYNVLLYKSELTAKGTFKIPTEIEVDIPADRWIFKEAYVVMGLNDLRGVEDRVDFIWNSKKIDLKPGTRDIQLNYLIPDRKENQYKNAAVQVQNVSSGLNAKAELSDLDKEIQFSFAMKFRGSKSLYFTPSAKETELNISSTFSDPIFTGNFLPEHKTDQSGFNAKWKILEYNKVLPPYQKENDTIDAGKDSFGVEIRNMVDHYTKINRASKYMFLVIALIFLVVFISEIIYDQRIHIFQYALVGFAIAVFFILLLSVSEFLGFNVSYLLASASVLLLNTFYAKSIFTHPKSVLLLAGLQILLFTYLFIIIQLEKSALLVGSIGLFVILATTMYVTRKIKWGDE